MQDLFTQALGIYSHGWSKMLNLTTNNSTSILTSNGAHALLMVAMTKAYSVYDTKMKKYRHMNFFEHECHLHVRVPRIKRDDGKVRLILPPWAGQLNDFSPLFEAFVIKFCKHMPVHNVCQLMNISDYKVWKLLDIYVDKARPSENLSGEFKRRI